jgi:hypothetical protein
VPSQTAVECGLLWTECGVWSVECGVWTLIYSCTAAVVECGLLSVENVAYFRRCNFAVDKLSTVGKMRPRSSQVFGT